jgi:hypothetical protein
MKAGRTTILHHYQAQVAKPDRMRRHHEGAAMTTRYLLHNPEHWRKRAEEIRTAADAMNDRAVKARMLKIADGYQLLARQAEERMPERQRRGRSTAPST